MNTSVKAQQAWVLEARLAGLTYAAIGRQLGLSRQRIQQIIAPPTDVRDMIIERYNGKCQGCGYPVNGGGHVHHLSCEGENYNDPDNLVLLCIPCHRAAHTNPSLHGACPVCGKPKPNQQQEHCSRECFKRSRQMEVTCYTCGKAFSRYIKRVEHRYVYAWVYAKHGMNVSDRYFCSRQCQGRWLGRNYGRHTTRRPYGPNPKLAARNESIRQHRAMGMKYKDLAAMFGLAEGSFYYIIKAGRDAEKSSAQLPQN